MSLRVPDSREVAVLRRRRPELVEALGSRKLTARQRTALELWSRHAGLEEAARARRVAADLGVTPSAGRQMLALAGAIRTRPGHDRRAALTLLREGMTVAKVQAELPFRISMVTMELAIRDLAAELLEEEG